MRGHGRGDAHIIIPEALREQSRDTRKEERSATSFSIRRTEWGKHALAAYTWTRTNRGPQRAWLHHIGKTNDPSCTSGHVTQDGNHLVFHCPLTAPSRARLRPTRANAWEELDDPHWVTEAGGEGSEQKKVEGIEAFFQDRYWTLKRREREEADGGDDD